MYSFPFQRKSHIEPLNITTDKALENSLKHERHMKYPITNPPKRKMRID
jgi:hypothetical protein